MKIGYALLAFLIIFLSVYSFYPLDQFFFSSPVYEDTSPVEAYFCPRDDCAAIFINLSLKSDDIKCAFYDLKLQRLISVLNETGAKVVLNYENYYSNSYLYEGMDHLKGYRSPSLMHHKFCIFDEEIVITGSMNPTERGNYQNNNNVVLINSTYISENFLSEFERLWLGGESKKVKYPEVYLNGYKVRNYFCPRDCEPDIYLDLIKGANSSIYFMTFSFTRDDIGNELINADRRGLDVKGVFERTQNNQWNQYSRLEKAGLDVRWDNNPANMHHKVFVVDNKTVTTGSTNPSNNGLTRNDENIIIFENKRIADMFLEEFRKVWRITH